MFGNVFTDEDTITSLYLPWNQDLEVVLPHVQRIRIRWLELTRNIASTMKAHLLTALAESGTSFSLIYFGYDEHAVDIDRRLGFLEPNLVELVQIL